MDFMWNLALVLIFVPLGILSLIFIWAKVTAKKPICIHCGKQIKSSKCVKYATGEVAHHRCFQKELDKNGGLCPLCKKNMIADDNLTTNNGKWYHTTCYQTSEYKK